MLFLVIVVIINRTCQEQVARDGAQRCRDGNAHRCLQLGAVRDGDAGEDVGAEARHDERAERAVAAADVQRGALGDADELGDVAERQPAPHPARVLGGVDRLVGQNDDRRRHVASLEIAERCIRAAVGVASFDEILLLLLKLKNIVQTFSEGDVLKFFLRFIIKTVRTGNIQQPSRNVNTITR